MAWEQIGTYEGIPFYADDSEGITDGDVTSYYLGGIQAVKERFEELGGTASQAWLKGGQVFVSCADPKDDPRFTPSGFRY